MADVFILFKKKVWTIVCFSVRFPISTLDLVFLNCMIIKDVFMEKIGNVFCTKIQKT